MSERTVTCTVCGCEFKTTATMAKYCKECAADAKRKRTNKRRAEARQREAFQRDKPKTPKLGAVEVSKMAKEARMSYGQYVAAMRM